MMTLRALLRTMVLSGVSLAPASVRAGPLYVSNFNQGDASNPSITLIDTTTGQASAFVTTTADHAEGLAFDRAGNLYLAESPDFGTPYIEKYTPGGVGTRFATLLLGSLGPEGLAFDSSGNLYVGLITSGGIEKITPGGVVSAFSNFRTSSGQIAFDSNGNLLFPIVSGGIGKIAPDGTFSNLGVNAGVTLAIKNDIVYTIQGNTNIVEVAPDGTISPFASSGLSNPVGMAFDPGGDLFVANLNSREIHRYSPDGTDHLFATPGEPGRTALQFLAIQPTTGAIPEPSSLLLAAIGMGVLAAVGLRSRRRATSREAREKTREEDTDHRDTCA